MSDDDALQFLRRAQWARFAAASLNRQSVVAGWEIRRGPLRLPVDPATLAREKAESAILEADLLLAAFDARFVAANDRIGRIRDA